MPPTVRALSTSRQLLFAREVATQQNFRCKAMTSILRLERTADGRERRYSSAFQRSKTSPIPALFPTHFREKLLERMGAGSPESCSRKRLHPQTAKAKLERNEKKAYRSSVAQHLEPVLGIARANASRVSRRSREKQRLTRKPEKPKRRDLRFPPLGKKQIGGMGPKKD